MTHINTIYHIMPGCWWYFTHMFAVTHLFTTEPHPAVSTNQSSANIQSQPIRAQYCASHRPLCTQQQESCSGATDSTIFHSLLLSLSQAGYSSTDKHKMADTEQKIVEEVPAAQAEEVSEEPKVVKDSDDETVR